MKKKQAMLALTAAAGLSLTALYSAPAAKAAPLHNISVSMPSSDSYIIKAGKLNVRTEPNHKGEILGTLSSEQKVTVNGYENADWAQIQFKGKKAYISTHFLMKTASQAKTAKQTAFYTPIPENGKAKQLSSGTEVTLLHYLDGGLVKTADLTLHGRLLIMAESRDIFRQRTYKYDK